MKLKAGDKVGIVACSNAQPAANRTHVEKLLETLRQAGLDPVCSPYIFEKSRFFSGTAQEKARALMNFYSDNGKDEGRIVRCLLCCRYCTLRILP